MCIGCIVWKSLVIKSDLLIGKKKEALLNPDELTRDRHGPVIKPAKQTLLSETSPCVHFSIVLFTVQTSYFSS